MILYPKMLPARDKKIREGHKVRVYDKIDGSNLRWNWNYKRGWWNQGTRTQYFDETDPYWGYAIKIFKDTLADQVVARFKPKKTMMLFTELYGPGSFAGWHNVDTIKDHKLYIIDVFADQEWLLPEELEVFEDIGTARHIEDIEYSHEWAEEVREGCYNVKEGVIIKSLKKPGMRAKIKTYAYLEQIKSLYGSKWRDYWE